MSTPAKVSKAPTTMQVAYSYGGGGAQKIAYLLADGMVRRGLPASAVAVHELGELIETPRPGLDAIDLGLTDAKAWDWSNAARRLRREIMTRRPAMVHAHDRGALLLAAVATRGMRRPPVLWFTWHIPDSVLAETGVRRRLIIWALKRCHRIFGDSQAIIDELTAKLPSIADRSEPFRHGVDECKRTPAYDDPKPRILWCARMAPSKGAQEVVRAAAKLRDEGHDFAVTLAGSAGSKHAWYQKQTQEMVRDLKLEDRVALPGWVRDVQGLVDTHNIAVQTSLAEGLSVSLLEQMMSGMAICATAVGDTRFALADGQHGVILEPGDEAGLLEGLRRMVTDTAYRRAMADSARQRALDFFSTEKMCDRALAMLREDSGAAAPADAPLPAGFDPTTLER